MTVPDIKGRPRLRRIDTFPYAGEQDMLYCRLTEIGDLLDHVIIVEADVTHGHNTQKPYYFPDQQARFEPWLDKIVYIRATDMPTVEDAWSRELAQREWIWKGLEEIDAQPDDILFHGDVDEIPTRLFVRSVRPRGVAVALMRLHPFAVDWQHPLTWQGTVALTIETARSIGKFSMIRNARLTSQIHVPDAGWHLSWMALTGEDRVRKMNSFCHPEIAETWEGRLDECYESGVHVDGAHLEPVDLTDDYPQWVSSRQCPPEWFRPAIAKPRSGIRVPTILGPNVLAR